MRTPKEHEVEALLDIIDFDLSISGAVYSTDKERAILAESAIDMAREHLDRLRGLYGLEKKVHTSKETENDFKGHPGTII